MWPSDVWHAEPMTSLELHWGPGGPCHYLDGVPVRVGDLLDAWAPCGRWLRVRFDYTWDERDGSVRPTFTIAGEGSGTAPPDTPCRWPARGTNRKRSGTDSAKSLNRLDL